MPNAPGTSNCSCEIAPRNSSPNTVTHNTGAAIAIVTAIGAVTSSAMRAVRVARSALSWLSPRDRSGRTTLASAIGSICIDSTQADATL